MKQVLIYISVLLLLGCTAKPVSFVVLETTDMHGVIDGPMSAVAGYIKSQRKTYGKRMILLDCGDNLQGSSAVYFSNYVDTSNVHIYSTLFNWLSYDALTVGNHDLEAGKKVYDRLYTHVKATVLCANAVDEKTGEPRFTPYRVFRRMGYKIAVIGLLTPRATEWIPEYLRSGVKLLPVDTSAAYWINVVCEKEKPDVVIGLLHAGGGVFSENMHEDDAVNTGSWIAGNIPGFHLICCGHTHNAKLDTIVNMLGDTVWMMEAGSCADHIARADIMIEKYKHGAKVHISPSLIHTNALPYDAAYEQLIEPFMLRKQAYEKSPVTELDQTLYSRDAMQGPSVWVDLIHTLQLSMANTGSAAEIGASISFASPAARNLFLAKGLIYINDIISYYPYENTLSIVRLSGEEIVKYLEYAYYLRLDRPNGPAYNFDSAAGILYVVNRDRPYGQRVEILSMADGSPFFPDRDYNVAMNTFRARGGGNHLTQGVGLPLEELHKRIIWESENDIRSKLLEWKLTQGPYPGKPLNHWRYI